MYLPRSLISHLYLHLLRTHHPLSPPVLLLVALEPDALCACRILTALLKRDYIPHKIQPIAGYGDLARAGAELVRPMRTTDGGSGGVVVCLGVGGLVDLEEMLGLEADEERNGGVSGVEVWVVDSRRPWNLANVFGGQSGVVGNVMHDGSVVGKEQGVEQGRIMQAYRPGRGGIIVFDDGDIEEDLKPEGEAYCALAEMPDVDEEVDISNDESEGGADVDRIPDSGQDSRKRSWSGSQDSADEDDDRPPQRRRSNLSTAIPSSPDRSPRRGLLLTSNRLGGSSDFSRSASPGSRSVSPSHVTKQPSARTLRKRLLDLRRKHTAVLEAYYTLGASYSEPISSLMYSLASELGREDNDLLWNAIVGVSSLELSGRTMTGLGLSSLSTVGGSSGWNGDRGERIRAVLRDEVRRLNPIDLKDIARENSLGNGGGTIQTQARSPTDNSIRLSPEPRFLLIRHWSLYDSMLHSPYLSAKLRVWNDNGRRRLDKLLAKMGISQKQCKQNYTHMDMELKRGLRQRLLKFAPVYGLDGLVPPPQERGLGKEGWGFVRCWGWKACLSATDVGVVIGAVLEIGDVDGKATFADWVHPGAGRVDSPRESQDLANSDATSGTAHQDAITSRFWTAYDALSSVTLLTSHIPTAQHLHRAILRTGTSLIEKKQVRNLKSFHIGIVKEGPDVALFAHPGALTKLALWVAEAIVEMEGLKQKEGRNALVMAGLDEPRGVYVVVGLGGGGGSSQDKEKQKKREEKRKAKEKKKEQKRLDKERQRRLRAERRAANGDDSDGEEEEEDDEDEDETEEESEDSDSDGFVAEESETTKRRGSGRNRFGLAFQEATDRTGARVKIDSFDHCIVEVKKDDLSRFLEELSLKTVVTR